jgi:hypothetical protein
MPAAPPPPHARAEKLLSDPALGSCGQWLRGVRRTQPQRLSEPEEGSLAEKTVVGAEVRQDSRFVHRKMIDRNLGEARDAPAAISA